MFCRDLSQIGTRAIARRSGLAGFRGFSFVEIMMVTSIAAILAALAAPGFSGFNDKRRVKAAAEVLYGDLQFARSEAIKRDRAVRIRFRSSNGGATWCYGMSHSDVAAECDCTVTNTASSGFCYLDVNGNGTYQAGVDEVRRVSDAEWPNVVLRNLPTFSFSPPHGTAPNASARLHSGQNYAMRVVVTGLGRVRLCSQPTGIDNLDMSFNNKKVPGYPSCT
jgi:type IV fimbrial biogenesis protein FimT